MENKIKNPVSKKNIFFFSIFDRLIDSIEKYVHKTEEDTFAENFDIVNEDSVITVSPKGSTIEKLSLGNGYSILSINDENFNAGININNDDNWIKLYLSNDNINKSTDLVIGSEEACFGFSENNNRIAGVKFDKNGIAVTTNNTTYGIYEPQLSTIVNACEYSYDEDNNSYKLKMLPKVNDIDFGNTPLEIDFGKSGNVDLKMQCTDEGLTFFGTKENDFINTILINGMINMHSYKRFNNDTGKETAIYIYTDLNKPNIVIERSNSSGETNADKVLEFLDKTNNLNVTFTVAELIALKALLPTT